MKIGKGQCHDIVETLWGFVVLNRPTENKLQIIGCN